MDRTTEGMAKVTTKTYKLPRGLLYEHEGEIHVLNTATIREIAGKEEDILSDRRVSFTEKVHEIVGNCLISLSNDDGVSVAQPSTLRNAVSKLLMSDILVSFFRLRELSVGSEYRQKVTCPECTNDDGNPFRFTVILNLSEFEMIPAEGDLTVEERECTTVNGNKVIWKMMDGESEMKQSKKKNPSEVATMALQSRVCSINGEMDSKKIKKLLISMSYNERQDIRDEIDDEGGIDTEIDCHCRNCGEEFSVGLDVRGTDFFSRSVTSKRSKKTSSS